MKIHHPIKTLVTDGRRHLICLPYSTQNLHFMGAQLGIGRHWFHRDHYDLPVKRRVEIERVCLKVSPRTIVRVINNSQTPPLMRSERLRMIDMPKMTTENHDHEAVLYKRYKEQGMKKVHFCPDWDYMAIHDKSPEFDACCCEFDDD